MNANFVAANLIAASRDDSVQPDSSQGRVRAGPTLCFGDSQPLAEFRQATKTDNMSDGNPIAGRLQESPVPSTVPIEQPPGAKKPLRAREAGVEGSLTTAATPGYGQGANPSSAVPARIVPTESPKGTSPPQLALRAGSRGNPDLSARPSVNLGWLGKVAENGLSAPRRTSSPNTAAPLQQVKAPQILAVQTALDRTAMGRDAREARVHSGSTGEKGRAAQSATPDSQSRVGSEIGRKSVARAKDGFSASDGALMQKSRAVVKGSFESASRAGDRTVQAGSRPHAAGDKPSAGSAARARSPARDNSKYSSEGAGSSAGLRRSELGDSVGSASAGKGLKIREGKDSSVLHKQEIVPAGGLLMRAVESAATNAGTMKMTANPGPAGASSSIAEQIAGSVSSMGGRGDNAIFVRLNPPELGTVQLRFQQQGDQVSGMLEVSRSQTKYEIEQVLPQIMRSLQDCGVQIKRLEVVLADQAGVGADRGQMANGGWSGHYHFRHEDAPSPAQPVSTWLWSENSREGTLEGRVQVGQNHVDMLA